MSEDHKTCCPTQSRKSQQSDLGPFVELLVILVPGDAEADRVVLHAVVLQVLVRHAVEELAPHELRRHPVRRVAQAADLQKRGALRAGARIRSSRTTWLQKLHR